MCILKMVLNFISKVIMGSAKELKTDIYVTFEVYKKANSLELPNQKINNWKQVGDFSYKGRRPSWAIYGSKESFKWFKDNVLHRDYDHPAIIMEDGTEQWYLFGALHRDNDKPAIIWADGSREWYCNGKLHRENDLPAIITNSGDQQWYKDGFLHRDNGMPAVIWANGKKEWYLNGKLYKVCEQSTCCRRVF